MKAVVYEKYGPPEVLQLKEVEIPTPKDNEVLVRIHATSVNSWDWGLLRGKPFLNRLLFGLLKPKIRIPGIDIAGRIEGVGRNAKRFRPGDEVFGDLSGCGMGGFAEYVCARENALTPKPASMTFEEAAAIPHTAILALQGLRDKGHIKKGQKVLINGAGGGAGTFGVQIAKLFGTEVTCVDSPEKFDILRSIGADRLIDYTQEDFAEDGPVYDLILDVVTYRSIFDYRRALAPKGIYVMLGGGSWGRVYQTIFLGPIISMAGRKKMRILVHKPNKGLAYINELFEAGKVVPVIDKRYTLSEVPEALQYFGEGHTKGKVVITLEEYL
jgi:NADPH:quinone reductase-like Zn-dependent oxidoreductase